MAIGDLQFENVSLLLDGEGTDASTTFTDKSKNAYSPVAVNGNAQIDTAQAKWGSSSMLFDGSGDYLEHNFNDFDFIQSDWTIEGWFRPAAFSDTQGVWMVGLSSSNNSRLQLQINTTPIVSLFCANTGGSTQFNINSTVTPTVNTWHYFKCMKSGTTYSLQIDNETPVTTTDATGVASVSRLYMGMCRSSSVVKGFNGHIDDFRVTNAARADGSAPSAAFPNYAAQFTGNITESLDITDWMISATKCKDGKDNGSTYVTGTSYTLNVCELTPSLITISPRIDYAWSAAKTTVLGDFVVAVDPDGTPHLWECTTAGETHATTEPTWNLSSTTTDNTTTWTYVAPLVDPVTLGPKIPS